MPQGRRRIGLAPSGSPPPEPRQAMLEGDRCRYVARVSEKVKTCTAQAMHTLCGPISALRLRVCQWRGRDAKCPRTPPKPTVIQINVCCSFVSSGTGVDHASHRCRR